MNELSLKISGQRFEKWNNFTLSLVYNSLGSTFSFDGLSVTPEQKALFKPLSYHRAQIYFSDELLLTGTILNTSTSIGTTQSLGNISGYSLPGILGDCEVPVSIYPLQFDGLSLREITEKIIKPFGLNLIVGSLVQDQADKKFDSIACDVDKKIQDFLSEMCKQKNIILTHNEQGTIVFTRLRIDEPSVATYTEGMPATSIALTVNGQAFHSEITVNRQASIGTDVQGESTIKNAYIKSYRPATKKQTTGQNDDTENAAKMIRGTELRSIGLTIETDRYKWWDGRKLRPLRPNHIIDVESPANFITRRTRFFVESVDYTGDQSGVKATIKCVLPECYNGEVPKILFE